MNILRKTTLAVFLALHGPLAVAESPMSSPGRGLDCFPRLGLCVDEKLSIKKLIQGSPSAFGGLLQDDLIVSIEGHSVAELTTHQKLKMLAGEPGTVSHLVVMRAEKKYSVSLIRVDAKSIKAMGKKQGVASQDVRAFAESGADKQNSGEPTSLDKSFVTILRHTENSDAMYEGVMQGLAQLPAEVKTKLRDQGVEIVIAPNRGEFNHTSGGCAYQVKLKKVVMAEYNNRENKVIPLRRLPFTTLHELGHAYDHVAGEHGLISKGAEFAALYQQEADEVPQGKRALLAYFLPPDLHTNSKDTAPVHSPPEECFASLFAGKYFKGEDKRNDVLKASFPKTYKFVENLKP